MNNIIKYILCTLIFFGMIGCGDAYIPPSEVDDFPVITVRIANFHGAYPSLMVKTHDNTWATINQGYIASIPIVADGYLVVRSKNALYDLETPVLFSTDVVIIRETNTGDRVTIDVMTRENKAEMCDLYAGFEDAHLYAQMCPNISPIPKEEGS